MAPVVLVSAVGSGEGVGRLWDVETGRQAMAEVWSLLWWALKF